MGEFSLPDVGIIYRLHISCLWPPYVPHMVLFGLCHISFKPSPLELRWYPLLFFNPCRYRRYSLCWAKAFDYGTSFLPVWCADESISNDKMRLTLNLRDDALHPTGHPLVLVFCYCARGKMQTSRSDCVLCQHDVTGIQCLWR